MAWVVTGVRVVARGTREQAWFGACGSQSGHKDSTCTPAGCPRATPKRSRQRMIECIAPPGRCADGVSMCMCHCFTLTVPVLCTRWPPLLTFVMASSLKNAMAALQREEAAGSRRAAGGHLLARARSTRFCSGMHSNRRVPRRLEPRRRSDALGQPYGVEPYAFVVIGAEAQAPCARQPTQGAAGNPRGAGPHLSYARAASGASL